jgi:hypothetical protein
VRAPALVVVRAPALVVMSRRNEVRSAENQAGLKLQARGRVSRVGESELRDRLYRGSGIYTEAKFHTAVRWLREEAGTRRLQEEQLHRYIL